MKKYEMEYVFARVFDRIFYYRNNDVIVEKSKDGSFCINDNTNGDTIWQGTTYTNGDFRSLMISCKNDNVSAYIEARVENFEDLEDMIDYLDSEIAEEYLTKNFTQTWKEKKY